MDSSLEGVSQEIPQTNVGGHTYGNLATGNSNQPACALCQRVLSSDDDSVDFEFISICGDCKFLLLEDIETPIQDTRRRISRVRRSRRFRSSESIEGIFAQRFSHMINRARLNQPNVAEIENQSVEGDGAARLRQRSSSRATPGSSRRWRRVVSDTESDGVDSLYGESESNLSISGYRLFAADSDAISFSAYGGDSDASVDGHSFLDNDYFAHPDGESDFDSDTDIDPMRAGLNQWDLDDQEEDNEWEEADAEEHIVETVRALAPLRSISSSNGSNGPINWQRQLHSPEFEGIVRSRTRGRRQTYDSNLLFANLEDSEVPPYYVGNSGDYLDARGLRELLEHLAETDSLRQGAPPAAVSYVNSLPCVVISEEHEKQDGLACAICKDFLSVGTIVNQLPCCHLYHPSCILPWLSARNSCPLCRYELPTDDIDYEERKQNTGNRLDVGEIQQQAMSEDSSSVISTDDEGEEACELGHARGMQGGRADIDQSAGSSSRETGRGRLLFLAAAPIVSLVGIVLVLWFGNSLTARRGHTSRHAVFTEQGRQSGRTPSSCLPNQRENRSRRWWSLF